jgi:hypothetical protein
VIGRHSFDGVAVREERGSMVSVFVDRKTARPDRLHKFEEEEE